MKIIKEINDDNKNVALILENDYDVVNEEEEEDIISDCLRYVLTKYFREPLNIYEEMDNHFMVEITARWISNTHILFYFNATANKAFENRLAKLIEILHVDLLKSDDAYNEFRKYKFNVITKSITYPFKRHNILIHDVVWRD